MLKPRLLSREEEAELAQSKKKEVVNDKLIGEISGAFVEAFDLIDQMEEDPDSNDDDVEVGDLSREGVIKLNELLIELNEPEVLKEIGEHIGKVLRIDCHTAMEARGKYARVGHNVDNCSYTIRKGKSLLAATEEDQVAQPLKPRAEHEGCRTSANDGTSNVCEEGDLEG
nr:hypothetical protein CFP56_64467 [Quercus suber]